MIVKLLTEYHLEFLSLKGGRRGSSASTHVKMSNCWKSHVTAQLYHCSASAARLHKSILTVKIYLARHRTFLNSYPYNNANFTLATLVVFL